MSSPGWLHDLRFALAPRRGRRHRKGRDSLRAATHRLNLEVLEDRVTPSFSPATSFPVGPNPQAVVTADFNNDGHLDLATASAGGTVSVLLGDGRGGFGAANHFATDTGPRSMAVGDFNNDGHLDLVTANAPSSWLSITLGNGDGTFRAPTTLFPSGGPLAVAVGDFNADGRMDIVVNEYDMEGFDYVQVLLGNSRNGFTIANAYTLFDFYFDPDQAAPGLAVGDLNGDGKLDAAVVVAGVGYAALGNGDGTFGPLYVGGQQFVTGPDSRAVAVGDFTRDGIPDLVVAGQTVNVLRGHGDAWFDSPTSHTANGSMHTGVVVADFNGDGKLDAVTSDADTGTVSELLGNGNGTLTYAGAYAVGSSPAAVAVGDFNGDGRPDVAAANPGSNTVSVLLNNGTWQPPPPSLSVGDATVIEGNTGTRAAIFTVTLSAPSAQPVTVQYATVSGTATAGGDYQARSGTLTIPAGQTTGTIAVPVLGDRLPETDETFVVKLSGATDATIADGQAVGTIVDNEPRISISDVTKSEGKKNQTTQFTFTVTLSAAYDQAVTMSFRTTDGTATTGDGDYIAKTGTITFVPGETMKTITIVVNGDGKREADEYFYLDLFGKSSNSLFTKSRGTGTILNDD
jgi:hypothetical protein